VHSSLGLPGAARTQYDNCHYPEAAVRLAVTYLGKSSKGKQKRAVERTRGKASTPVATGLEVVVNSSGVQGEFI